MKISTKNTKVLCLPTNSRKCTRQWAALAYTAAGEAQVPRGGIYEWRKAEREDWYIGVGRGAQKCHAPKKFLENMVILRFERRFVKQIGLFA